MLKTTKKKMWTAANILNHVVRSKASYVRIILTMAKRRLCAAIALAVVAWNLLRKPNQEAYENYFRTDIVSESKRLFSDFSDYKQGQPLTPYMIWNCFRNSQWSGVPARPRSLAVFRLSGAVVRSVQTLLPSQVMPYMCMCSMWDWRVAGWTRFSS